MLDKNKIFCKRWDYTRKKLNRKNILKNPLKQFLSWYKEANKDNKIYDANAFSLATVGFDCRPSIRTVLLRCVNQKGFIFFTNYKSVKSNEINNNPEVSLLFPWIALERQVKILGRAKKISKEMSKIYFSNRPRSSCLSAWASKQSMPVASRLILNKRYEAMKRKFTKQDIPIPKHWGGYIINPYQYEFWQGRKYRLHDRFLHEKNNKENWNIKRLYP